MIVQTLCTPHITYVMFNTQIVGFILIFVVFRPTVILKHFHMTFTQGIKCRSVQKYKKKYIFLLFRKCFVYLVLIEQVYFD